LFATIHDLATAPLGAYRFFEIRLLLFVKGLQLLLLRNVYVFLILKHMDELLIITLLIFLVVLPSLIFMLRFLFKKSILFTIGIIWLSVQTYAIFGAYMVGRLGFSHISWALTSGTVAVGIGFYLMAWKLKKPLKSLTDNLQAIR
jgi:hypothetical protein